MASAQLTSALAMASAATSRGLKALVRLANALGTPEEMPEAQKEAKKAAAEAEEALRRLNQVLAAALATKAAEEPGLGARSIYSAVEAFTKARVEELEREQKRNRRQQKLLVVLRNVALGLLLLCTPLLSFDAVREALGVTQEGHLVPCLATVLLVCQVAAWASERSGHHLATALDQQRHQLAHYRHLAHATPPPNVTQATREASVAQGTLEEVANQLRQLLGALEDDLQDARGFPATTRALGTAAVALGTVTQDEEATRRLAEALRVLPREVAGQL